jgi:hypothetical protein
MNAPQQTGRKIVIVAYRPKPGKEAELLALTKKHVSVLREQGLATDHPTTICKATDGTIVEIFEWAPGGIERAHNNPVVQELWKHFSAVCDYVPVNTVTECGQIFAGFDPTDE